MNKYLVLLSFTGVLVSLLFINANLRHHDNITLDIDHSPGLDLEAVPEESEKMDNFSVGSKKLPFFNEETVNRIVDEIWSSYPTVDGLLEPHRYDVNFETEIAIPTQTNVFSGKITATRPESPSFDATEELYLDYDYENRPNVNFVKTAKELSCVYTDDYIPEFIHYQQKPWATPYFNDGYNSRSLENRFAEWISTVSRMIQPFYSKGSNQELYFYNQHYAGEQFRLSDDGLTRKGEILVKSYAKYGGMLDASHVKDKTFEDMINISSDLVKELGLPIPIFLNHANIDASNVLFPSYLENRPANYSRNKSPKEICQAAKTGGVWGVMPVKIYTDQKEENADFYDLADQLYFMKNYECYDRVKPPPSLIEIIPARIPMVDYKGELVRLINHIIVSSDANIYYFDKESEKEFYIDEDAANPLKWKNMAKYLLSHDFNNDGFRDFTVEDIKKIFGLNAIKAYARALDGALPFSHKYCSLKNKKRYYMGRFLNTDKNDLAIADSDKIFFSKSYLQGHFDGVSKTNNHKKWCLGINQQSVVGDFNGDGLDDFLCYQPNLNILAINFNGENATFSESRYSVNAICGKGRSGRLYAIDMNNDGEDELLCHNEFGDIFQINYKARGSKLKKLASKFCTKSDSKFFISFLNSDRKPDFYCHHSDGTYSKIISSPRRQNFPTLGKRKWCKISDTLHLYLGDFDGDGRSDRLCHSRDNGRLWIDFAKNSFGSSDWSDYSLNFCIKNNDSLMIADTGGDEQDDVHCFNYKDGYLRTLKGATSGLKNPKEFTID